jgi:hypothetical protein
MTEDAREQTLAHLKNAERQQRSEMANMLLCHDQDASG